MTVRRIRLEDLLGRRVRTASGEVVGRIEEVHAVRRGSEHEISEYLIGPGALVERWALTRRLLGRQPKTVIARWDQLDVQHPDRPVLTCSRDELQTK